MPTIRVPVEVDITYVNKTWFSNRKQNNVRHYVIGIFQRGAGNVPGVAIIESISDNSPGTIEVAIMNNIEQGCMIYAEEKILPSYLRDVYEIHELKAEDGHIKGDIHVNNVKNMWRDLKRLIKRTHVQVSQKHLQGYCNEVAWRLNTKHLTPTEKFNQLLSNCEVKDRKTSYKNLIK